VNISVALFDLYTVHVVNLVSLDPYICRYYKRKRGRHEQEKKCELDMIKMVSASAGFL
jgi:hypothetical protein